VITVFETDSKFEADAVAERLRSMGIGCVVDGQNTAALGGFYVPLVLKVRVLDASQSRRARRIANDVLGSLNRTEAEAPPSPRRRSWVIVVGIFLVAVAAVVVFMRVIGAVMGR
jgi:hypothetical protein